MDIAIPNSHNLHSTINIKVQQCTDLKKELHEGLQLINLHSGLYILMQKTVLINPLTLELNPSEQCCLPEFLLGILNFNAYSYKKKAYLIDFFFKFNEIKFCALLMNCVNLGENVHLFL